MGVQDIYQSYLSAGTSFQRLTPPSGNPALVYGLFNQDTQRPLLPFIDTGDLFPGGPHLLKFFNSIRFGGGGKIYVRALVDDSVVAQGYVTLAEDAYQASVFRFPQGTAGYKVRLQMPGVAWWRYFDIEWDPVSPKPAPKQGAQA